MGSIISLCLPILLSAVIVFIASSVIHMFLTYHRKDVSKLPDEDSIRNNLSKFNIPPGDYVIPYAGSPKAMNTPEYKDKREKGPVAYMTFLPAGRASMAKGLTLWFLYSVVVSIFSAYIASRALGTGAHYLEVFRFAGATAFIGYSAALWQNSIWYGRSWKSTLKSTFDGLIYALLTAGTFGWLWPR